jgi:hypothetical protein
MSTRCGWAADRGGVGRRGQPGRVGDDPVAAGLRLLKHGQVLVPAGLHLLVEEPLAAAEGDVRAGLHQLLGDRAGAAVLGRVDGAGGRRRVGAFAVAAHHVRTQHGRGGVLDLGGGHVPGAEAGLLGELEDVGFGLPSGVTEIAPL